VQDHRVSDIGNMKLVEADQAKTPRGIGGCRRSCVNVLLRRAL
jgi:hypothetical protein